MSSAHLRHSSFSNPSVALPTSQLILQPFRCFTYVTALSPTLPLLHLRHCSFSNPSFASPTSLALHLRHLVSSPCIQRALRNNLLYISHCLSVVSTCLGHHVLRDIRLHCGIIVKFLEKKIVTMVYAHLENYYISIYYCIAYIPCI